MKKNLLVKSFLTVSLFGIVGCSSVDALMGMSKVKVTPKEVVGSDDATFKLMGAPGNNICIASTVGLAGTLNDDIIVMSVNILHDTHASDHIDLLFDYTPTIGTIYNASQGGNCILVRVPLNGTQLMVGPNGNAKMTNSAWSYWMKRDGEQAASQYSVPTAGGNTWPWFDFTEGTIEKYNTESDSSYFTLTIQWDLKRQQFNLYTGRNGGAVNCIEIPGSLTLDTTKTYYPCMYYCTDTVGNNMVIDDLSFRHVNSQGILVEDMGTTNFSNPDDICYAAPFTKKLYVSSKERTRFGKRSDIYYGVDFVIDVPEGKRPLVLQLTDIQIIDSFQQMYLGRLGTGASNYNWAPDKMYLRAFRIMRETIDNVVKLEGRKPDLIALSGDNTYGEFDINMTSVKALAEELNSYGIPFAFCYGNHDQEAATGKSVWVENGSPVVNRDYCDWTVNGHTYTFIPKHNMKELNWAYAKQPNCMFIKGHAGVEGHGNYCIGIRQGGKLVNTVYFMDSHGNSIKDEAQEVYSDSKTIYMITENGIERQVSAADYNSYTGSKRTINGVIYPEFKAGQKSWYSNSQEKLKTKTGAYVPAIGFTHHPFKAWQQMARWYGYSNPMNIGMPGHIGDETYYDFRVGHEIENDERFTVNPGDNGCWHTQVSYCQYVDEDNYIHNINKNTGALGWFFGHEHLMNATVTTEGVKYGFGVKGSQYDSYVAGEIGGTLIKLGSTIDVSRLLSSIKD